ncbi:MAG: DEAD/DEAH box helicase [Verrucomicrobiota bacterium]|nr:MAG: DEAD/DEAH box helicase [Verrucomicrobiota bacterium]
MLNRAPAVIFKRESFEKWMEIFATHDWPSAFTRDELRNGLNFYERCNIKEIEIRPDDIVVRYQNDNRSQFFALIDVDGEVLSARSSLHEDPRPAVGALLAMDELILDKQDSLFTSETNENEKTQTLKSAEVLEESAAKLLHLSFFISGQNLCFKAYWTSNNKLVFPDHLSTKHTVSSKAERDEVVKLIHLARKANFVLFQQSKEYRMTNVPAAVDFCRHTLPKWSSYFELQIDPTVQKLLMGVQNVHAQFLTQVQGEDAVDLTLQLSNDTLTIAPGVTKKLIKGDGQPMFVEGVGAVRLPQQEVAAVRAQQSVLGKFHEIPRYMIYSIFSQIGTVYKDSEAIRAWKDSFASAPTKPFILPKVLRSYQREGVLWINHILSHGFHGLVADDMGLGKTLQVLTFISKMNPGSQAIVVCPASVLHVWQNEAAKFFPRLTVRIFSADTDFEEPSVNLWIVSYTQLRRHKTAITKKAFQLAVLDEAQFIKNSTTKVFHACNALKAQWRLALSGTPIENNLLDLWSIFRFLMPGLLGEKAQFLELCKSEDIADKIKAQIAPFMLRRTKETVAKELPQKLEVNVLCEMTPEQLTLYKDVVNHTIQRYRNNKNQFDLKNHRFGILSALTRLRQIACDPGIIPGIAHSLKASGKLTLLREMLRREFDIPGRKVVIFSQFVTFLQRIRQLLKEEFPTLDVFEIIGSTKQRNIVVDRFQNTHQNAAMLVSLKAGGVGITLTAAETVFLMDPWWNPAAERQAMDRVHRIGQEKNVTVYRLITQNSIESSIQRLQERKSTLFNEIIDSLKVKQHDTAYFLEHVSELLKFE